MNVVRDSDVHSIIIYGAVLVLLIMEVVEQNYNFMQVVHCSHSTQRGDSWPFCFSTFVFLSVPCCLRYRSSIEDSG